MNKKIKEKKHDKKYINKSQEPVNYKYIVEDLRKQAWSDPEVKKNWEEFDKKQIKSK